ncbi:MAG: hypothetical protein U9N62_01350 [Thermotogota bacterium]|nr:hypothetical protein [Thermotogota bacterium]
MKSKFLHKFILIMLLIPLMAFTQDESIVPGPGEIKVEISAGAFNFSGDNEKVVFSEGVEIKYEDIIINAPTVTAFFVNEDTVEYFYAESSDSTPVYLYKDKETFTSKSLKAYVQKKAYFLYELRGTYKAKNAKGKSKEIILAAEKSRSKPFDEKNVTEAQKGYLTTCEDIKPHYRFQANYIVVKESNEIIAYDLLMYIYDIPVLPYPVYFSSLERKAQPVESSFTFTGSSGIQTHLRFNYYSKEDEIGAVFFDTVGDGDKKGNTIGAENKFTLPDGKTRVYFYGLQKTQEDFSNRSNQLNFELARKWDEQLETLFFFNNKMSIANEEIASRNTDYGINVKGKVNNSPFSFNVSKSEVRSINKNANTITLPSFAISKMDFEFLPGIFPISLNFKDLKFSAANTSEASVSFLEKLSELNYNGQYGLSSALPKIIIRDVKLVNGFTTDINYSFKSQDEYTDDFKIDNTFTLPKIGFSWNNFFGINTQYIMRAGLLQDYQDEKAYRYSENVITNLNINLFIWKNTITHDYVFLKSDGNTSRFNYNKEKNLVNLTSMLDLAFISSKITVKTSYDFLKDEQKLSNPKLITNTDFRLLDTRFKFDTTSIFDASDTKFLSTDYSFAVNNNYFNNQLNFVYLYDQDVNIRKLTDSFGFAFGPINNFKKFSSNFELVFNYYEESQGLDLDKLTNKNSISFGEIGPIDSLVNNTDIQILPKEEEADQKINYIKNSLNLKFDKTTLGFDTKYSRSKKIDFDFSGSFEKLKLNFGTRYDMDNKKFETIKIAIVKDLHCWQNETSIEFALTDQDGEKKFTLDKFSTSFAIKQFPEKFVKVEPLKKEFDLAIF